MLILSIVLGIFLGWQLADLAGAVCGGVLAWLIHNFLELNKTHRQLRYDHLALAARLQALEQQQTAPVTTPAEYAAVASSLTQAEAFPAKSSSAAEVVESVQPSIVEQPASSANPWLADTINPVPGVHGETPVTAQSPSPPRQTPRPAPAKPREPSPLLKWISSYFSGGNILVRVGIIVLFFGVAFLLKYAAERNVFPIESRLLAVSVGAIILLMLGLRLRRSKPLYALALQGGGLGMLYLTGFAALRLYSLLSPGLAFALFVLLGVLTALLAIRQNAVSLAVLGVSGAFLAPILASTGSGSHVILFSYYAVLNLAILGIICFKHWRLLAISGFLYTFIIGAVWGYHYYQPALFASTEPFLILFFLIYVAIAVLLARRCGQPKRGYAEASIVFGTPIISFALQSELVEQFEYGLAWSALALSGFYLLLAARFCKRQPNGLLGQAFLALGVIFATLAIPFALDDQITSALWAVEGAGLLWIGCRQQQLAARVFGIGLQLVAALYFLDAYVPGDALPVANAWYLGQLLISLAALFSGYFLLKTPVMLRKFEKTLGWWAIIWGELWWFGSGLREVYLHVEGDTQFSIALIFIALSSLLFELARKRLQLGPLRFPAAIMPIPMAMIALVMCFALAHPFASFGWLAWSLAFGIFYGCLRRQEQAGFGRALAWRHASVVWLLVIVLSWESAWLFDSLLPDTKNWDLVVWAWVPALLMLLIAWRGQQLSWPLAKHFKTYLSLGLMPVAACLIFWSLDLNRFSTGSFVPLPYLPVFNPLDLTQILVFAALALWLRTLPDHYLARPKLPRNLGLVLAALMLFWLSAVLARTVHHWLNVPFEFGALYASTALQAALSLLWASLALAAMIYATRRARRIVWLLASVLLGAVVLKLFFVDLASSATVARIVSFLGVGSLLLVIGYFSPVPPRAKLP